VREELAADHVADGEDVGEIRPHLAVDLDLTALAHREAELLGVDSGEERAPTDGDQDTVCIEGLPLAVLLDLDADAVAVA
jgi:hypothetical protein